MVRHVTLVYKFQNQNTEMSYLLNYKQFKFTLRELSKVR